MITVNEGMLDGTETWTAARIEQVQRRRLGALIRSAYRHLPFYQRLYDGASVDIRTIERPEDLARLPMIGKADLQRSRQESGSFQTGMEVLQNEGLPAIAMTSGTTGTDFLYCNRRWRQFQGSRLLRAYWWAGLRPGMRMMLTVPAWHCWAAEESYLAERLGVTGVVPWGTFLPRYAGNLVDAIVDLRPEFVSMFLPMLYAILAECRGRGLPLQQVFSGVRCVLIVGSPITPGSRQSLQAELGVDIYSGAGTTEGLVAMECSQHRGYHLFVDTCYLEVVDPSTGAPLPHGERGRLVLTAFNPHGTVYVRFDTGDLGRLIPGQCECGRTWPLMEIYDRLANIFVIDGREFVPYDVRSCLDDVPELIGIPFSVIRRASQSPDMWLAIQRSATGSEESLDDRVKEVVKRNLHVGVTIQWVSELPVRWKGAPVIDEAEWRGEYPG